MIYLILILLTTILYQDFKHRAIAWYLVPALFISLGIQTLMQNTWLSVMANWGINTAFLLTQLVVLMLYFAVKNKKFTNIIDTQLGWGDVLVLLALAVAFSPVNFIAFYLLSLVSAIIIYVLFRSKMNTIPLAGIQAGVLVVILLSTHYFNAIQLTSDTWLETIMYDN